MQIPFGKRALCTKMATDETADKDRRAYKVPIPGNKSVVVTYGYPLLLGVTQMADGYNFAVEAEEDSEVYLLLYRKRGREPFYELLLDEKYRTGRIFSVFMKKLNVIIVFNKEEDKILMCRRTKEPYKGKLNLVGGKVEKDEDELQAAYRELEEETAITRDDIKLINVMNFEYKLQDMELEVYAGKLNKEVNLVEEINKLLWVDKNDNFFDIDKYAGEGNIGHMLRQVEIYKDEILK